VADEEVVIVEEDNGADNPLDLDVEEKQEPAAADGKKSLKKKLLLFGLPAILLVIIATALAIYFLTKSEKTPEINNTAEINETAKPGKKPKITASELERLIEKAKALYDSGDKEGALKLFNEVSIYSEGVSNYNLGVAKMGEKDYAGALEYFKNSIKNADNELPSAINASVCYLKLGDKKTSKEYLSLAKASLYKYTGSPLYSYYYALINYYEGNYYEALSAISAPTSKFFKNESNEIAKRAYLLFGDSADMMDILLGEKNRD
jgi:tetratricopeptide (TPR) repeat protein